MLEIAKIHVNVYFRDIFRTFSCFICNIVLTLHL